MKTLGATAFESQKVLIRSDVLKFWSSHAIKSVEFFKIILGSLCTQGGAQTS